jgi:outer membrane protein OmpA-like peptidoglycan-associated protein
MPKHLPTACTALAAAALAACAPAVQDLDRTQQGAATGAAAGAIAGAVIGDDDRLESAAIGGLVGAGIGSVVGNQLDRQAQDLRREIGDDRVTVETTGGALVVTMPQDIVFTTESAAVRADLQDDIRALGRNLQQYPASTVQVLGHTDNTGSAEYNLDLSQRRARAVAGILYEQGVNPGRVTALGRGEDQPVATNQTPEGRQANRRVEIVITPTA